MVCHLNHFNIFKIKTEAGDNTRPPYTKVYNVVAEVTCIAWVNLLYGN